MEIVEKRSMRDRLFYATAETPDSVLMSVLPPILDRNQVIPSEHDKLAYHMPMATFGAMYGFELPNHAIVQVGLTGYINDRSQVIQWRTVGTATFPTDAGLVGELPSQAEARKAKEGGLRSPGENKEAKEGEAGSREADPGASGEAA